MNSSSPVGKALVSSQQPINQAGQRHVFFFLREEFSDKSFRKQGVSNAIGPSGCSCPNQVAALVMIMAEQQEQRDADYWDEARTPLSSLMFLLPLIVTYELGVLAIDQDQPDALRNGADFWMRSLLSRAGAEQVLLPLIVIGLLLAWHIFRRHPWRVRLETQLGMMAESLLLAVVLVAVGQCHDVIFRSLVRQDTAPAGILNAMQGSISLAVSYIGAGVYEEVMFRLLLVPASFLCFRMFDFPPKYAAAMAAVSTSFLFALAHHVGPAAEAFSLFAFSFRAAAGLFFASVFLLRGFGITVGCHAAYDLLVGILLAV